MSQSVSPGAAETKIIMMAPVSLLEPRAGDGIRIHAMASHFAQRCDLTLVTVEPVDGRSTPARRTAVLPMRKHNALLTVARSVTRRLPYESARFGYQRKGPSPEGPFDAAYLHLPQAWDMWRKLGMPRARVSIIDFHNDDFDIWRQRAEAESKGILRAAWSYWMRLSKARTHRLVESADLIFCVSDADRDSLVSREGTGITSKVFVVPNGVELAYFQRPKGVDRNPREMIFIASLDARRNQSAAKSLLAIWPTIARRVPGARLSIVGRNPPGWLLRRNCADTNIVDSPADIRPYLWRAAAFLAPFETGGGTKIKILEAMAAGTPIIASRAAMQGLPVVANRHYLEVGDSRDAQDVVVRAFDNQAKLRALTGESSVLVREFDWAAITARAFDLISRRVAMVS